MPGSTAIPPQERGVDKSGACFEVEVTFVRVKARAVFVIACLALVVGFGAGCTAAPSSSPDPTTTMFSNEQEAFEAAEETYRAYVDALNQVDLSDPATFEGVYAWTTGELNSEFRKSFSEMHADGWAVGGDSLPILVAARSWNGREQAQLDVCQDVSAVTLTDQDGNSMVRADRPDVQTMRIELVVATTSSTGLLVSAVNGRESGPMCD